jgi:Rod binding domain-containing protein
MDPVAAARLGVEGAALPSTPVTPGSVPGVKDAAEGFEAIFLRQMLRDLRKTTTIDGEKSAMTGLYTDMFDDFMAEHLAKTGGVGLADVIRTYLERSGR